MPSEDLYDLYQRGMALLEHGDYEQATVPLAKAAGIAPEKASIREALGRALTLTGERQRARRHLAIAACLRPERRDYRVYRERLAAGT